MIQNSTWINQEVKDAHNPNECVYKQSEEFYTLLNNQCLEECDWCPFENTGCTKCGGVDDILMGQCYKCNKCNLWG